MLMAHTDVVPAPAENWTVDPFAGVTRDGWLIGRGAVDMKNELAARVSAFAAFAAEGRRPRGDLVLVAEADEERNVSDVGMSWLVRERPDLLCDLALNEGGGFLLELENGRKVVPISVGEKKVTSLLLRVHGASAHASVPDRARNAVRDAARVVERLYAYEAPSSVSDLLRQTLFPIGAPDDPGEMLDWATKQHPVLGRLVPAMIRMSVTPTGVRSFEPANVVPPVVEVTCDCRALPHQDENDIRAHLGAAIGPGIEWDAEFLEPLEGGYESPVDTDLYRVCEEYVADRVPGAILLPTVTAGFTDSHWVRKARGTVAYGFAPVFETEAGEYFRSMHGADEKIRTDDIERMAEFHLFAIRRLLAG